MCWPAADVPAGTEVTEQYLLDLEREAFLSLIGEAEDAGTHAAHAGQRQAAPQLKPRLT